MSVNFVLHRLGALDLDLASRVHGQAFAPVGERAWTRQELAELVASPGVAGWTVQSGDSAVGLALCRIAADEAELLTIAVVPSCRRCGAGRCLLEAVIAHARAGGARAVFLEVAADNPAALALYRQAAFDAIGERKAYYRRGEGHLVDAVVMRLTLTYGG
jgi:[ribosomal protein S18]-alanine N-acetyltransferase